MGKIRSAWEIALEKTQDISVDKEKFKALEELENARKAIGAYLNDDDRKEEDLETVLKETPENTKKEALRKAILGSISLNISPDDSEIWNKLKYLASLAADNPGNSFAVEVFDISLLHLFTTDHDERLVIDHRGFPKKRSARVDNDAVGAFGLFGKTLAIESIGAIGLKFALISKLELRSNAAAQASVGIEFAKRGVVLIDAAQLGGHAAVDAAVD